MTEDHPETTSAGDDRPEGAVEVERRIEKEQEHLPEGRPPRAAAERLSWRVAIWALALGALATLVTAYLVGGMDAMSIGVPAVLLYLAIGALPFVFVMGSRIKSKRRVRERVTERRT